MSRGAAKRQFTTADLAEQTAGIECRKDAGVIDETPGAYNPSRVSVRRIHRKVCAPGGGFGAGIRGAGFRQNRGGHSGRLTA